MSHKEQRDYVRQIRNIHTEFFTSKETKVLDVGSLDINGSCKKFFSSQHYIGCDIGKGKGVDIISPAHLLTFTDNYFDCIISCEAFEHDKYLPSTLINIVRMLRSGGLFLFTCASGNREEHGTKSKFPESSPHTNEFYRNVSEEYIKNLICFDEWFSLYEFDSLGNDLRFYGIKK